MGHYLMLYISFAIIWTIIVAQTKKNELMFVHVIWRHGDRAPIAQFQYPNNPNTEEMWPFGWSELTQRGMKQQFALGQLLRKRYILNNPPLLEKRYNPKQIYIRSTDVNRTLVSAMSNLAGMFQDGIGGHEFPGTDLWPNTWTPIPVHTIAEINDHVGNVKSICPRAVQLHDFIESSREFRAIAHENRGFFRYISEMSGRNFTLSNINEITDIIYCELAHNLTQPKWISTSVLAQLRNLTNFSNRFFHGISRPYVPELIRIRGGNMLKEIIERMKFKLKCDEFSHRRTNECRWIHHLKYYAYSAHDTTIAALMSTLGEEERVIPGGMPHYTASVAIELWRLNGETPAIRILYLSSSYHDYRVITDLVHGCSTGEEFCELEQFEKRSQKFLPIDIETECRANSN